MHQGLIDHNEYDIKGINCMSLLWMEYETEFKNLVDASFESERNAKSDYFAKLSDKALNIIYRDTKYNIDFLYTAFYYRKKDYGGLCQMAVSSDGFHLATIYTRRDELLRQ